MITTLELNARRGVQNVTKDLALGLKKAGHTPIVYTRQWGPVAQDLRDAGLQVEINTDALKGPFDVIHGHHLVPCAAVLARFPETPAIFVAHDNVSWFDMAPRLPSIRIYAGVSASLADRAAYDSGAPREQVRVIINGVDTERFAPGPAPAPKPKRALAFAKNEEHVAAIRDACAQRGVAVDYIGAAVKTQLEDPSKALPNYDLVFASALSAMEAMACLRPTIVCDGRGLAGMVDMARYEAWRPQNFGLAVLNAPLSAERMLAEIDRYDPAEAVRVGERSRVDHDKTRWVETYVALYREAMAMPAPSPAEAQVQWARHVERWTPRAAEQWQFAHERQVMINDVRRLRLGVEELPRDNRIAFGLEGSATRFMEPMGFEQNQNGVIWTNGRVASLRLRLGLFDRDLMAALEYAVNLPQKNFELEIVAAVNGVDISRWTETGYEGWQHKTRTIRLPVDFLHPTSTWITFRMAQTGGPTPPRPPAFGLRAVTFRSDAS